MSKQKPIHDPGQSAPGGAGAVTSAIDATNEKDRGLIREAVKRWPKRWPGVDDAKKQKWLNQLERAGDVAEGLLDNADPGMRLDAARTVVSVVKTAHAIEGQNQADEHLAFKAENPGAAADTGPAVIFNIMLAGPEPTAPASPHEPIIAHATSRPGHTAPPKAG